MVTISLPFCFEGLLSADESDGAALFRERIQPALEANCYSCHSESANEIKGGLLVDRAVGLLQGGHSGPALIPGNPEGSLLIQAIRHEDLEMPPKGDPLDAATISQFERWVALGAPDPRDTPMISTISTVNYEQGRQHWAFQPVPLEIDFRANVNRPHSIDAWVERRLVANQLDFAAPASKHDLVRRVYYDLTGLPPTLEEYEAFVGDSSPDAYSRLVDRLLANPRFGERQSHLWLDVVRFAESEGFEYDRHLPDAWRFRDYVIDSFNQDKPYDRFLLEQLAGDELDPATEETLAAAVFHRLGAVRRNAGNPDIALSRNEVLTERADVIGNAVLGLTVGCARCHDHKFDPISQRDYYQFQAYLAATAEHNIDLANPDAIEEWEEATRQIESELKALRQQAARSKGTQQAAIESRISALEARLPAPLPKIPTIRNDFENVTAMHVLKRGIWERKGDPVGMKPLDVFVGESYPESPPSGGTPRTQLAEWLTDAKNPLTARVIVNRIWQHYFGVGIVETANDFGHNGMKPSHPELLDYLARELVRNGWRLKPIHRSIVMSRTYRQTARLTASAHARRVDPNNRLLWRHRTRRLTGEEMRDSMLLVAGVLNDRVGGVSVMLPVEQDLINLLYKPEQWQVTAEVSEHFRRSVYLIAKRNLRLPFMEAFDQPALLTSCSRRESSTHAPQALELLNGTISNQLADAFGRRLRSASGRDSSALAIAGYWRALGRLPSAEELTLTKTFLASASVEEFALALFNLNEFMYVF